LFTITRCRQILGKNTNLTDSEVAELRRYFYDLTEIVVEDYVIKTSAGNAVSDPRPAASPPSARSPSTPMSTSDAKNPTAVTLNARRERDEE